MALLFPNDADGVAWSNKQTGLGPALAKGGYATASQPDMYAEPTEDFTAQITAFKDSGADIVSGLQKPPDFTNFYKQSYQQGLKPKIMSISKAGLFHESIEAIGDIAVGCSDHNVWHPTYPYKSDLAGATCQQFADQYTAGTGTRWTSCSVSSASTSGPSTSSNAGIPRRGGLPQPRGADQAPGINGPIDFTLPVKPGTVRPMMNVYKIKIAYGQWIKNPAGSKYPYDQVSVLAEDPGVLIKNQLKAIRVRLKWASPARRPRGRGRLAGTIAGGSRRAAAPGSTNYTQIAPGARRSAKLSETATRRISAVGPT